MRKAIGRLAAIAVLAAAPALADSDARAFFNRRIRPILAANCWACHTATKMGDLQLDSKQRLMSGGKSGPVIVPGDPTSSLLIKAVEYKHERLRMPPAGKLTDEQIADLKTWVKDGAHWVDPDAAPVSKKGEFFIRPEQRAFWSFQPIRKSKWAKDAIDKFILSALDAKGLKASPPADKRTLLRRATFDLTGLPPSPGEVAAFLADSSPGAFTKVVDRLLASPRFGERWGRHWLDVARYGEDDARGVVLESYPNAWRYRDWVVAAYNSDMPYDLFVKAQIAGDLLEPESETKLKPGLGFFGLGPWYYDIAMPPLARANELNDRVDALTRGFLGLTAACARCHDHKYDPISSKDFYALTGVFASSEYREYPLVPAADVDRYKREQQKFKEQEAAAKEFEQTASDQLAQILTHQLSSYMQAAWKARDGALDEKLDKETLERIVKYLGEPKRDHPYLKPWDALVVKAGTPDEVAKVADDFQRLVVEVAAEKKAVDAENKRILAHVQRNTRIVFPNGFRGEYCAGCDLGGKSLARDKYVLWEELLGPRSLKRDLVQRNGGVLVYDAEGMKRFLGPLWTSHMDTLRADLDKAKKALPPAYPFLMALAEAPEPVTPRIHVRGSAYDLGDAVPRRFLAILSPEEPKPFQKGSGRLELAEEIVKQPLAARVIVNRIWQQLFGSGIVRSTSNFGQFGDRPSHPELLDYLASRIVERKWYQKKLIREIMLSAVYQLSSEYSAANFAVDPDNRLLWRATRRRIDAEAQRDGILFVSGDLDPAIGGPSAAGNHKRRTLYGKVSRFKLDEQLTLFDFPSPSITSEKREMTIVPLQKLFLLNSEFVLAQSASLAGRLQKEFGDDNAARIKGSYRLLYAREATEQEVRIGLRFLEQPPADSGAKTPMWSRYAQALLASNEFTFLD